MSWPAPGDVSFDVKFDDAVRDGRDKRMAAPFLGTKARIIIDGQ